MNSPQTGASQVGKPDAGRLQAARDALAAATAAHSASMPSTSTPTADLADRTKPHRRRQSRTDDQEKDDVGGANGSAANDAPEGLARARQIAIQQLAMGPRTRQQLADKMRDRECTPEVIERVLERMTEVGLVDDEAYAHMLVRTKREGSGLAVRGLRHELRKKGVPEHLAEAAVAEVQPDDERAQAEALVAARLPRLHGLDRDVQMRRLGGYLARKGYPAGVSFAVIRNAIDQAPEHVRD